LSSGNFTALDLEKVDKLDLADDDDVFQLGKLVEEVYEGSQGYLDKLGYTWDENIRFYMGDQHIEFSESIRQFEVIPKTKYNKWVPRPVTNMIFPIVQTCTSILTKNKPNADIAPNSDSPIDEQAAKLAARVQDAKWEMDDEQLNLIKAAKIAELCGTVFRKDYWDPSKGPEVEVKDEKGLPKYTGRAGDSAVEIKTPFDVIPDIYNGSWFVEAYIQPLSWIRDKYDKEGDGYTGRVDQVHEEKDLSPLLGLKARLSNSSGFVNFQGGSATVDMKDVAVVKECYIKPTKRHPRGLMVVVADGKTLYAGPSPYFDANDSDSWHPYTEFFWEGNPFRYHGLSLVENIVPLQRRLNSIDSLIILSRMTMVAPQWLIPTGCGVPEGSITGAPGLNIYYNPTGASGAAPTRQPGVGLPADIYRERESCIREMHMIAGDNEVLQGVKPAGVNTAAALQMLLEQSFSKYSPLVHEWERFIEKGQQKKLRLIQSRYKEPRPALINRMRELNRENLNVQIQAFIGADLRDNVNVRIEAGSSIPRSKIMEQETYKQLAMGGMFGPIDPIQNPMGNQEFLEKFGISPIKSEMNTDVKKAKFVVAVLTMLNRGQLGPESYPQLQEFERNPQSIGVHLKVLTDAMKSPEFEDKLGAFKSRFAELMMAQQALQAPAPTFGSPMPNTSQGVAPAFGPNIPQGPGMPPQGMPQGMPPGMPPGMM
jgi:hypothetical protein